MERSRSKLLRRSVTLPSCEVLMNTVIEKKAFRPKRIPSDEQYNDNYGDPDLPLLHLRNSSLELD
jgi:hypothetical protein